MKENKLKLEKEKNIQDLQDKIHLLNLERHRIKQNEWFRNQATTNNKAIYEALITILEMLKFKPIIAFDKNYTDKKNKYIKNYADKKNKYINNIIKTLKEEKDINNG